MFFNLATVTLEVIRDFIKVAAHTKFWACTSTGTAVRVLNYRRTDTQTHKQTDFIPSTADAGGKSGYVRE